MTAFRDHQMPVIEINNLSRRFAHKTALDGISLSIPRGQVFGIVGENGAGKTTTIKHMLGMLKAQEGQVRTFGLDPVAAPREVLARIGYLSEDPDLPGWMNLEELCYYLSAFYPNWDQAYAKELIKAFDLNPKIKIKKLSKGQRARAGLVTAQAHRPDLLLLDEPSSGLDPIVRRDILGAVIRTVVDEGRTVVFSSHLLDEVERVSDQVAMVRRGRIVLSDTLDNILEGHHFINLSFAEAGEPPQLPGQLSKQGEGCHWRLLCQGSLDVLRAAAASSGAQWVNHHGASLDEIFVALAANGKGA